MMDRLVQVAAAAMAARAGVSPDDPEPQIAAHAILGLWRVQFQAIRLLSVGATDFEEVYEGVRAEVARAARLIDSGLWAFEVMVQGRGTREQLKVAAEAAQKAGQEVAAALRQARGLWRQVQSQHPDGSEAWPPVGERYPHHGRPWRGARCTPSSKNGNGPSASSSSSGRRRSGSRNRLSARLCVASPGDGGSGRPCWLMTAGAVRRPVPPHYPLGGPLLRGPRA